MRFRFHFFYFEKYLGVSLAAWHNFISISLHYFLVFISNIILKGEQQMMKQKQNEGHQWCLVVAQSFSSVTTLK